MEVPKDWDGRRTRREVFGSPTNIAELPEDNSESEEKRDSNNSKVREKGRRGHVALESPMRDNLFKKMLQTRSLIALYEDLNMKNRTLIGDSAIFEFYVVRRSVFGQV